ncbi:MAG: hypothetical protein IKD50_06750 [Clostridia bacterium]|nr:hypothetical protein [Clostridia bacterium]
MMKRIWIIVLTILSLALFFSAHAETSTTLLVYMCGADLQSAACEDIYEMGIAEVGDNVNIVILAGGAEEWDFDEIQGNTRNLITLRDGNFESITDWGWKSMGSEESLLEFLRYGLTEYPADRTVAVLWDHGAGSEAGVCFDDTTEDQDGLSLLEINNVLYDLHEQMGDYHIDIFGCDACMMATYEMAAMLSYYDIDYYIASEELEPGIGWHYTSWLEKLGKQPDMTAEELCGCIVDNYMEAGLKETPDDYLTLSVISLHEMGNLQEAVEKLASTMLGELQQGNVADLRRERSRMYSFGSYVDGSWDMVDMGAMLDAYARHDAENAALARKQLSKAVLYSRQTDNLQPCSGLSVLIPQDTKNEFETYAEGVDLSFYMPNWIGFVKAYTQQLQGGSYSFSATSAQQMSGTGFLSQIAELFSDSGDVYGWNEETETYTTEGRPDIPIVVSDGDYAFTAKLSEEDLQYLDYVEGMLALDISDEEVSGYVDFGLMQNNLINWDTGDVYSLFDGSWPVFGEQMVPLYDQMSNERGRRSLIPVKLNGEYTYLVVEFTAGSNEGRIIGANAGYDENGLPIRTTTKLREGDIIIPVYTMYVGNEESDDMEETEFDGDEIIWRDGMAVTYEDLSDGDEPLEAMFCFVLNDIFGEYTMTDLIAFEI